MQMNNCHKQILGGKGWGVGGKGRSLKWREICAFRLFLFVCFAPAGCCRVTLKCHINIRISQKTVASEHLSSFQLFSTRALIYGPKILLSTQQQQCRSKVVRFKLW